MVAKMVDSYLSTSTTSCANDDENNNKRTSSKIVSWKSRCFVRPIMSRDEYTDEEIHASWFSKSEYKEIQMSCIKQVQKMDQGRVFKDKKYSSRGLEGHTRIGSIQKQFNRKQAIDAVLDEQDRQLFDEELVADSLDDIALSQAYQCFSSSCQLFAHSQALLDQKDVEGYAVASSVIASSSSSPVAAAAATSTDAMMVVVDKKAATKMDDTMSLLQQHIRGAVANCSNQVKTIHRYVARSA